MMTILQQGWDCIDHLDLVFMFVSSCCPRCISTAPLLPLRTPIKLIRLPLTGCHHVTSTTINSPPYHLEAIKSLTLRSFSFVTSTTINSPPHHLEAIKSLTLRSFSFLFLRSSPSLHCQTLLVGKH